jgi:hypothetical protein
VHLAPAERALYDWMRRETPADAVIVDRDEWNRVIAYAHRQLLLGGEAGSQFGFPVEEFRIRREVLRAVEAGQAPPLEPLRRLERPAFVVYRPARPAPARVLPGLQPVYDHSGYRVYRLEAAK